ncbi:VanZ family protein [Pseudalkalibacillus decolorationis]|uniref:VanZ family protein n=1 Tax=Pseudalkalibacillus decolorationis TaxID=163879 RepID=UPI002147389B|nr:VanZ family protein [Pseudalkalibacillus decolorationis]
MKKFILYWLPVLIWVGIIFYSSSQPYQEQDIKPFLSDQIPLDWVSGLFGNLEFDYAGEEVSVDQLGEAGFVEFFLRKLAHLSVYFILFLLIYRAIFCTTKIKYIKTTALLLSFIYAASDEFHQGFTANRSPYTEDVLLDTVGIIIGALNANLLVQKVNKDKE